MLDFSTYATEDPRRKTAMNNSLVLMAAGMAGLSLGMVNSSHADIWLKDPTTGCQVWSGDDGSAKEVASWSGSCASGKAIGNGTLVD